ncbi:hypothetical protein GQX74_006276 [Glossina fuscipes]|nr:hypothetical protein GQX74_006276 [Glossina fuscipes]
MPICKDRQETVNHRTLPLPSTPAHMPYHLSFMVKENGTWILDDDENLILKLVSQSCAKHFYIKDKKKLFYPYSMHYWTATPSFYVSFNSSSNNFTSMPLSSSIAATHTNNIMRASLTGTAGTELLQQHSINSIIEQRQDFLNRHAASAGISGGGGGGGNSGCNAADIINKINTNAIVSDTVTSALNGYIATFDLICLPCFNLSKFDANTKSNNKM